MVNRILTISLNSFREMYRDKFFLILVFAVIAFFGISFLLGELSFEEHKRILFDLGISAIHWLNLGLCIFIGGTSLRREIEKQTYMTLLSSPLSRFEFLIGKFGGVLLVSIISTFILGIGLFLLLNSPESIRNFIAILVGISFESAILLAISILLSLIFSPFVGLFVSFSIFLISNWLESLKYFADKSKNAFYIQFANSMDLIFPNLYRLNWRSAHILEVGIPVNVGLMSLIHAVAWIGLLLVISNQIFKRKNLI